MTSTKEILKTLLLLASAGTSLAAPEAAPVEVETNDADTPVEVETRVLDIIEDGEELAALQKVMAAGVKGKIEIPGTGTIKIGDENTTGVLNITKAENVADDATASMTRTLISVTGDTDGTEVYIGRDAVGAAASMTNVKLDLSGLKNEVAFTVSCATVSATQIIQKQGSIKLVDHAGVSLVEPSYLHNLYVDSTSHCYGSVVMDVIVDGNNTVEFTPQETGYGVEELPLIADEMISTYQLYGLTFEKSSELALDLGEVIVHKDLMDTGGSFYIYMYGVRWKMDGVNSSDGITDLDLLADSFRLFNFGIANGVDISDRLVVQSAFYSDGSQGLTLEIKLLPDSNVPEPTTVTLSMLLLVGLAARRRRK